MTGTNVLAVEVHQVNNTSSDISFDAELLGGRPLPPVRLGISQLGGQVVITWPNIAYDYLMQSSPDLGPNGWLVVTNAPDASGNPFSITLPIGSSSRFFRLKR